MENEDGQRETRREEINEICKQFYSNLFQSRVTISPPNLLEDLDPPPSVLISEVRDALKEMPTGKIPGKDDKSAEVLHAGGYTLWRALAKRLNAYMAQCKIPSDWKSSKTILLYKKGDREDFKNYRPICLLSTIYRLCTKIISNRLSRTFDEQQPREQAGFRGRYSTIDNIFVLNQLLQKSIEHNLPICLVFFDDEKAFDSVETNAVLTALKQQVIENNYIKLLSELNNGCSMEITLFHSPLRIPIQKGVRQGDPISPKLFTAFLEMVFRNINWSGGVNIDGEWITHLRFADDIVLVSRDTTEAEKMLHELDQQGKKV
ncbi:hypothetical protein AB6A40_011268, partial [Gnathostoma spinigerum]